MFQNSVNGKVYIGKSSNLEDRYAQHIRLLRKDNDPCVKLNRAWQKYGEENFTYSILCYCKEEELNTMEMYYINIYNSCANGYNCTLGGEGIKGYQHTEKTKEVIRQCSTGRKHTEEAKKHMSDVQKGRVVTESHKQAMRDAWTTQRKQWVTEHRSGENNPNFGKCGIESYHRTAVVCSTGEVFATLVDAAEWCGLNTTGNLSSCSNGRRKYCGKHPVTGERLSWRKATDEEASQLIA